MESLAGAKDAEVTRLRAALQSAQANINAEPPKKTVIDDTAPTPAKKPAQKKAAAKPTTTPPPAPAPATKPQ